MRTIDYGMCGCLLLAPLGLTAKNNDDATCGDAIAPRNVIFILSDDHRYDFMDFWVRCRGSKLRRWIVSRGTAPICPTRSSPHRSPLRAGLPS